jgi:hypothetical protein
MYFLCTYLLRIVMWRLHRRSHSLCNWRGAETSLRVDNDFQVCRSESNLPQASAVSWYGNKVWRSSLSPEMVTAESRLDSVFAPRIIVILYGTTDDCGFRNLIYTPDRTPWMVDRSIAVPLPTWKNNEQWHRSTPRVGCEPMIGMFER